MGQRLSRFRSISRDHLESGTLRHKMPTVLRSGPCRVYFFSHEPNEPPHVHVDRGDRTAKFWLEPVMLARNLGFAARELTRIERLIRENQDALREAWHGYFGT